MDRTQLELFSVATPQPQALPAGARWRTVSTPHQRIGFVLQRSRRRSIGFTVDDSGLRVTAPTWATLAQVDDAVARRSRWILEKLRLRQERLDHLALADTLWKHEGRIPYFGVHIKLELSGTKSKTAFHGTIHAPQAGDTLQISLPCDATQQRVRDTVHLWLQKQARHWFDVRLHYFLQKSGQSMRSWRLSAARTRWGSCSSDQRIMLNWRLIHFSHDIIDYVIAHEVAHLREMNHSKAFWQELERLMPGFAPPKAELRRHRPGTLPLI